MVERSQNLRRRWRLVLLGINGFNGRDATMSRRCDQRRRHPVPGGVRDHNVNEITAFKVSPPIATALGS